MLRELSINDFAIIEQLNLKLGYGFVVFTGETGAGKSIIVDAVEMILGGRADASMVRSGAERSIIEGVFQIDTAIREEILGKLEAEGLRDSDESVLLGREIRLEGRNICRVNGRTVNLAFLREIGELLVDVHGQSEHLSLLRVNEHIHLLDRYAQIEPLLAEYSGHYSQLLLTRRKLAELRQRETDAVRRMDLLSFQIQEIDTAKLIPDETAGLKEERSRLANAEHLTVQAEKIIAALVEGEAQNETALDQLGIALEAMDRLAKIDASMSDASRELEGLVEQTTELGRRVRGYLDNVEFNPQRLEEVEERLALIHDLERKYGGDIPSILNYAEKARLELDGITNAEARKEELLHQELYLLEALRLSGLKLSEARQAAGDEMARLIEEELADLRMEGAQFNVAMTMADDQDGVALDDRRVACTATGLDHVEFMIAPNPGEGLKPLVKIASGGETSRMMLGLKSVLTAADHTPSLIFDEIDQGIGGRVGVIVGRKLWNLSADHQVLCITHLPQLAAYGDQHFRVEKQVDSGRTHAVTHELVDSERIPELALMLGGITEANLESAADMLRTAAAEKCL
ncbi:MAG: DNA repair protein RecN [Anaerolineales bacterium]|nr:DNA repair protein RecN [Anaerolineales bacterium]